MKDSFDLPIYGDNLLLPLGDDNMFKVFRLRQFGKVMHEYIQPHVSTDDIRSMINEVNS